MLMPLLIDLLSHLHGGIYKPNRRSCLVFVKYNVKKSIFTYLAIL